MGAVLHGLAALDDDRPEEAQEGDDGKFALNYSSPGPVIRAFHHSSAKIRGIRGPLGSGKTSACAIECFLSASRQETFGGIKRFRAVGIRNTYGELKSTTLRTWQDWFPIEVMPAKMDAPIESYMEGVVHMAEHPDAGRPEKFRLEMEVLFLSLDRPEHVRKLRSLDGTMVWLNEASELPVEALQMARMRAGRYPPKRLGGVVRSGVVMDTNSPDDDHWWYRLAEQEKPRTYEFFTQPPALLKIGSRYYPNPRCENVQNQPLGIHYWLDGVEGARPGWIDANILNKYASSADGKPVYPEFDEHVHVAKIDLDPMRGVPLWIGVDAGLTPAAVIGQFTPDGQLRLLDEVCAVYMGMKQFLQQALSPFLLAYYPGIPYRTVYDPAADSPDQGDIESSPAVQLRMNGFEGEAAPTNDYIPRRDALADFINRRTRDGPGLLLSGGTRTDPSTGRETARLGKTRKGLAGAYKYKRVQVANEERYQDVPVKNEFSHPCEGAQYIALRIQSGYGTALTKARPVLEPPVTSRAWT